MINGTSRTWRLRETLEQNIGKMCVDGETFPPRRARGAQQVKTSSCSQYSRNRKLEVSYEDVDAYTRTISMAVRR
jgi:hypothetical protein